jgi:hypothetical protein
MSADRYVSGAVPGIPAAWNKYAYVIGDPVNLFDPTGQSYYCTDDDCDESDDGGDGDPGDTQCDSKGTNCYNSITVDGGKDDGGAGNTGTGQTWGQFGQAAGSCAASAFGFGTAVAGGAVASGTNTVATAGKFAGATKGTSLASNTLSKMFPKVIGATWAPTLNNPLATSTVLGRVLGRWVPVAGQAVLIIQGAQFVDCLWASDNY